MNFNGLSQSKELCFLSSISLELHPFSVNVSELISVGLHHLNPVVFSFADTDHRAKALLSVFESRNEDATYCGIKYDPSTVWLALFIGLSEVRGPVKATVFNSNSFYRVVGVWLTKF